MIRTLQRRFVLTAMIAVTALLLAVLGALNVFNAISNARQIQSLLDDLAMRNSEPFFEELPPEAMAEAPEAGRADTPEGDIPPPSPSFQDGRSRRRGFLSETPDENARMSALYFTVTLDSSCHVTQCDTSHISGITDDQAKEIALALDADRESGTVGNYRYKIFSTPDGYYKVVFLDTSARRISVLRVALLSLLLGSVSWVLMLFFVIALSLRAIRPIAENMDRQRQFVTDAGHELKTPLAIILANLDAMELRTGENKYSRNIRSQATRLSDLVKNLLTLARVDEYSLLEHAESFDLSALCAEIFSTFREPAELRNISFETDLAEGLSFRGDRNQISQLCSILGDNAVKYCTDGGHIRVSLLPDGHKIRLTVANTVDQIPDLDRIFDRFYRSDSSRNQKTGGFGIGLSAARSIAQIHRADLRADYDPESAMVRFILQFPA